MPDPTDIVQATNYAAQQSDRWLFVALLIIGLLSVFLVARYFTGQLSKVQDQLSQVQGEFNTFLRTENSELLMILKRTLETLEKVEKKLN